MDPSRNGNDSGRPKPKLFSMSQSRALLESKRQNTPSTNYSQSSSNLQQDRGPSQNPPRVSLSSFLAHPVKISTPTPPRNTYGNIAQEQRDENSKISYFCVYMLSFTMETVLGGSSPLFKSSVSPERAYIPSIRLPSAPSTFRLPSQHPSQTPFKREMSGTPRPHLLSGDDESASHDITVREPDLSL